MHEIVMQSANGSDRPFDYDAEDRSWQLRKTAAEARANGDLASAIQNWRSALSIHEKCVDAHCGIGAALVAIGDVEAGLDHYSRALALFGELPQDVVDALSSSSYGESDVHCRLAAAYRDRALKTRARQDFMAACDQYQKSIDLNPNDLLALWDLSMCQRRLGKKAAAIETLRRFIEIDPYYEPARIQLGHLLLVTLRLKEFWRDTLEDIRLFPQMHREWRDSDESRRSSHEPRGPGIRDKL